MADWLPINNYEGFYEVSDTGLVRSVDRISRHKHIIKGRMLKATPTSRGYLGVSLSKNDIKKTFSVHQLVANAFIDNPDNKAQVNHKDENKLNNNVTNLEWVTCAENLSYGTRTKRAVVKTYHPVVSVHKSGFMRLFKSQTEASKRLNISLGNLNNVLSGRRKQSKGYKFIG